jgi:integrase
MAKLTKRTVEALPVTGRDYFHWDDELPRFGVRVKPSGAKTYVIQYRNAGGQTKRHALGKHGVLTADQARTLAHKRLSAVAGGADPASERRALREAPTITDLTDLFLGAYAAQRRLRPSYLRDARGCITLYIRPALGSKKVADVTPPDVRKLHLSLKDKPAQANRTLAILSKMFNLAIQDGLRATNPCKGIDKYAEEKRTRWLTEGELGKLTDALAEAENQQAANAARLLLLTGARLNEALKATWDMFDLERGVWTKPSHSTKQKKTEHVALSAQTVALLVEIKAAADKARSEQGATNPSSYVFPNRTGDAALYDIKRAWKAILKAAELENVRLHDLRHTFASHLVQGGFSLEMIGRLLGHTQAATTRRYAHLADDPLRALADRFGAKLDAIKAGRTAEVVTFPGKAKA